MQVASLRGHAKVALFPQAEGLHLRSGALEWIQFWGDKKDLTGGCLELEALLLIGLVGVKTSPFCFGGAGRVWFGGVFTFCVENLEWGMSGHLSRSALERAPHSSQPHT